MSTETLVQRLRSKLAISGEHRDEAAAEIERLTRDAHFWKANYNSLLAIAESAERDKAALVAERDTANEKLHRIAQWAEAYPLKVFPEPDLKKARALLESGGMTLDAVSASAMRHVLSGVKNIVGDAALANMEGR